MGLCLSSGGGAASEPTALPRKDTALVLMPTGELREYPRPATAARVLQDSAGGEGWFLCDSDKMGFEGAVPAVAGAEALRAGRIYFVLPAEARRRGLRREEVAALAVKASAAIANAGAANSASGNGRRKRGAAVAPLVFSQPEEDEEEETVDACKAAPAAGKRRRPAAQPRRPLRRFAPDLTAIPEGETSE